MADAGVERIAAHLEEALALVAEESPIHFAALQQRVGPLATVVRIEGRSSLRVSLTDGSPRVTMRDGGDVTFSLSQVDLVRLVRGELTIDEGILDGSLSAKGAVGDLLAWLDGMACWLHGALRCPSLPELHARFLRSQKG